MDGITPGFEAECQSHLDRFFAAYPDRAMQERARKALRLLRASDKPLQGKAEGWAAGILYALYNDGKTPCGIPAVLNAEFEQRMGVTMSTARYRATRVMALVTL